jgi:hypothetical protein
MSLILTGNKTDFEIKFSPSIMLDENSDYEIALLNLDTFYSVPNVDLDNNKFTYSKDAGTTWKTLSIPQGSYEIKNIKDFVEKFHKHFELNANVSTGKCEIFLKKDVWIDFRASDSIGKLLGFDKEIIKKEGLVSGSNIVNIIKINTFLVNCDLIKGSYLNESMHPVLYSFFPKVPPGYKINESPTMPIYLPLTTNRIDHIRIWLCDQDNKILNLRGETITVRLHIRKIRN